MLNSMRYVVTCLQDHCLFDWTRCVLSLPFFFSNIIYTRNINSSRSYYENNLLLVWYESYACESFSANLIVFTINDFHKQPYVKDSWYLVETAICEIAACLTCRKQSDYFDKRDVARSLNCYIYKEDFCDNSLHLDPTNSYYRK